MNKVTFQLVLQLTALTFSMKQGEGGKLNMKLRFRSYTSNMFPVKPAQDYMLFCVLRRYIITLKLLAKRELEDKLQLLLVE